LQMRTQKPTNSPAFHSKVYAMMAKCIIVSLTSVALAFEDPLLDDGLSLLQMRTQKHDNSQDPKYIMQGRNTVCKDEEVITYAQCVEAQRKKIVPNAHQSWSIIYNQRGHGRQPSGCFMNAPSRVLYFNDEPVGGAHPNLAPICSPVGGRAAEIAGGLAGSCQDATCVPPTGHHSLTWGPNVVVPKLTVLEPGEVCEEACGLLSYAQCQKAGETGLIEAITGLPDPGHEMGSQTVGPGHVDGTVGSGCTVHLAAGKSYLSFSPLDTIDGQLAGLTTASGVGVAYAPMRHVCGECTTTTTTTPPADNEAAAIGDPHMHTASGKVYDLLPTKK